jgi:Transglutaminase-like superfamily
LTVTNSAPGIARRWYGRIACVIVCGLALINLWGAIVFLNESSELRTVAATVTSGSSSPSEEMRKLVEFVAHDVRSGRPKVSFLLPCFERLRPTALQVLRHGGDCSYKTRAFIVLTRKRGIHARKVALHNPEGEAVHAVAVAETERGSYIVDLLYGIVFEHADGTPISLEELKANRKLLAEIVRRAAERGNRLAERYPLSKYVYDDVKTYNWEQNAIAAFAYRGLTTAFGKAAIDDLPRPYFESEPALMLMILSGVASLTLLTPLGVGRLISSRNTRRRQKQLAGAGLMDSR